MDINTPRPGIRPLMHEPNRLWPWVFRQHQVWVDINGSEHEIESMPRDYVANVIRFCRGRAVWIYLLVEHEGEDDLKPEWEEAEAERDALSIDFARWLEATPLMRALRRRVERPKTN
ncbi:MAG: hypothetical protein QOI27_404 [Gaiellaceae bacterium]|jgi:hypothetical protein|nr:hypothetical protein [Gaiellaceae bacterium]